MTCLLGIGLSILWWVCLALVVIGEAQALLLILATIALLVFGWGQYPENRSGDGDWH